MQKGKILVLACTGLAFLVCSVSAFTVSGIAITPSGTLNPGDTVNVSYTVYAASGAAFPVYDDLQFISGLDDMVWSHSVIINGVVNVRPVAGGRILTISGYELSYEDNDEVLVKVTLKGIVPLAAASGATKNLVTIQELDSRGYAINSTIVSVSHLVGTPTPTPTPSSGTLIVTSIPSGADIYLDNAYKGFSPLTIDTVSNGNHVVVLRLEDYEETSRTVSVMGSSLIMNIALSPLQTLSPTATTPVQATVSGTVAPEVGYGALSVTTSPPGAMVYVDGEMKGVTPTTIPGLSPGKHSVLLDLAGYTTLNTTITVSTGRTSEYSTALSPPAKTPGFGICAALLSLGGLLIFQKTRKKMYKK